MDDTLITDLNLKSILFIEIWTYTILVFSMILMI